MWKKFRAWWKNQQSRLKALFERYGWSALGTYAVLKLLAYVGIVYAISAGFEFEAAANVETAGLLGAAWIVNKGFEPIRIPLTILLTPFVVNLVQRVRRKPEVAEE